MFSCMFVNTVMALITLFLFYFFYFVTVDVDGGVKLFGLVILYPLLGKKKRNLNEREIQANVGTCSSHHHTVFHSSIPILLRGTFNMLIEI